MLDGFTRVGVVGDAVAGEESDAFEVCFGECVGRLGADCEDCWYRGHSGDDAWIGRRNRGVFMAKGQRPRVRERHDFDFRSNNSTDVNSFY